MDTMTGKEMFAELVKRGVPIEIYEHPWGDVSYGLQWGGGTYARALGIKRKDCIRALNWADKHDKEAMAIITNTK